MRILIALACATSLAACASDDTADAETPAATTEPNLPAEDVGSFEITTENGGIVIHQRNADGTFVDIVGDEEAGGGAWNRNEDGQMCFGRVQGDDEEACWTEANPLEDGSWMAIGGNGQTVTIRRIETADTEEEANAGSESDTAATDS